MEQIRLLSKQDIDDEYVSSRDMANIVDICNQKSLAKFEEYDWANNVVVGNFVVDDIETHEGIRHIWVEFRSEAIRSEEATFKGSFNYLIATVGMPDELVDWFKKQNVRHKIGEQKVKDEIKSIDEQVKLLFNQKKQEP